jgi:acyl phosphate:glycerol-3-phosphate acyltransferase
VIAVLLLDALKGFAACKLAFFIAVQFTTRHYDIEHEPDIVAQMNWGLEPFAIFGGIFAVLGHNYTCWLKFKGGKGIATTAGVYLVLAPWPLLIALTIFILALVATRYASVASISGAIALVAAVWILPPHNLLLGIVTTALGAMAVYKHKSNIQRLIAGTENRLQFNKKEKT